MRYFLTRLYDYTNTPKTALIKIKDPREYYQKLIIHNNLKNYKALFELMIKIYTDGSCLENPGNGGWAAIINDNGNIKKISGSEKNTTNNRMELMAPINALKNINSNDEIDIFTDSQYVKAWYN